MRVVTPCGMKWSVCEFILDIKSKGFAEGLDVGCRRNREVGKTKRFRKILEKHMEVRSGTRIHNLRHLEVPSSY